MDDNLKRVLFENEKFELTNIKFSKGTKQVSEQEFREVAAQLVFEVKNELTTSSDEFGDRDRRQVDVKELVSRL